MENNVNKRNVYICEGMIEKHISIPEYFKKFINPHTDLETNPSTLCPLHTENTPSWRYSAKLNRWRCFGKCDTSGGVIKLHQLYWNKIKGTHMTYFQAVDSFRNLIPALKNMPPVFETNLNYEKKVEDISFELKPVRMKVDFEFLKTDTFIMLERNKENQPKFTKGITDLFQLLSYDIPNNEKVEELIKIREELSN